MDNHNDVATGFAELNSKSKKILFDLCDTLAGIGQSNIIRYYAALLIADSTGKGWVYSDWYISVVSHFFHVQPRQVKKSIRKMADLGMIEVVRNKIYYRKQEKIIDHLDGERTTDLAAITKMSDLCGAVRARSHFHVARLQAQSKNETIMISRKNRQEIIGNPTPKTQRKYDKIQGVKHQNNYAIVEPCKQDDKDVRWVEGVDGNMVIQWKEFIGNSFYYVRRLSNLYLTGNLNKVGIRRRSRACLKSDALCDPALNQLYYTELPKRLQNRTIYLFKEHASCPLLPSFDKNLWVTVYA